MGKSKNNVNKIFFVVMALVAIIGVSIGLKSSKYQNATIIDDVDSNYMKTWNYGLGSGFDIANAEEFNTRDTHKVLDIKKMADDGLVTVDPSVGDTSAEIAYGKTTDELSKSLSTQNGINVNNGAKNVGLFKAGVNTTYSKAYKEGSDRAQIRAVAKKITGWQKINNTNLDIMKSYLISGAEKAINSTDNSDSNIDELFKNYGTSVFNQIGYGASLNIDYSVSNASAATDDELQIAATAAYGPISASSDTKIKLSKNHVEASENVSVHSYGGTLGSSTSGITTLSGIANNYAKFLDSSVSNDPDSSTLVGPPSSKESSGSFLTPIWQFANNKNRRDAIEKRYNEIVAENSKSLAKKYPYINKKSYVSRIFTNGADNANEARAKLNNQMNQYKDSMGAKNGTSKTKWAGQYVECSINGQDLNQAVKGWYIYEGICYSNIGFDNKIHGGAVTDIQYTLNRNSVTSLSSGYIKDSIAGKNYVMDKIVDVNAGAYGTFKKCHELPILYQKISQGKSDATKIAAVNGFVTNLTFTFKKKDGYSWEGVNDGTWINVGDANRSCGKKNGWIGTFVTNSPLHRVTIS